MIINPGMGPVAKETGFRPTQPRETFHRSAAAAKDPVDRRGQGVETTGAQAPTAEKVDAESGPRPKAPLPPLSPMMDRAALHTQEFLAKLEGPEKKAWTQVWKFDDVYHPDAVDLPFPFPGDHRGLLECNQMSVSVKGLKALGAHGEARGILENWLSLGERYTAIPGSNQLNELGRSGLPKWSGLLLQEASEHPDPTFLKRAHQVVGDDYRHNWCDTYFKQTSNGLTRFCDVDYSYDATLDESGGAHNKHRFQGDPQPFNPVDLNAYLYRTEKDMAEMSRRLGLPDQPWEQRAAERKENLIKHCWDEEKGFFFDYNFRTGERSQEPCLAAFSVLQAGLLDPGDPADRAKAGKMLERLDDFVSPQGIKWDSKTPAPAREVLEVAEGLEKFGADSSSLLAPLRTHLQSQAPSAEVEDLCVRALLNPRSSQENRQLTGFMSPRGMERLRTVSHYLDGGTSPRVGLGQAGTIDRRLQQLHDSLLDREVLSELRRRDLLSPLLGLKLNDGEVALSAPPRDFQPVTEVKVGGMKLDFAVEGLSMARLDEGAVVLKKGEQQLPVVVTGEQVILGDRAYPKWRLAGSQAIPGCIFSAFHTAGGNPTMENFFHHHRDWLKTELGPHCKVDSPAGRPDWKKLYDFTHESWDQLTIDPSVVDHDTAVQYFNHAAVPSLGIFKTQFNWDTMFMAKGMQLQGQEQIVSEMTDNLLYLLKSTGRVPNAARSVYLNKSQPPFLPSLVRMSEPIRERSFGAQATDEWVKEAYEVMAKDFHQFWREDGGRGIHKIGDREVSLSRWGGPNHKFAMDESGFDTTSRFYGKTMDLIPPDLNAFLWGYSKDMEAIALRLRDKAQEAGDAKQVLQYSSQASSWGAQADKIKKDVIDFCWDEEDGMFRDFRFQNGEVGLDRKEDALSACVAPLWVGMLDSGNPKEKEMIERSLDNISRFEKEHGLAATAEDYGHPEMQWNGPSGWAPLHMMAIESQVRYGRHDSAARQTQKWLDTMARVKERDGVVIERYDVVKGDHPPVQKGRYEETQGEGPGFGWTNATVPWAMVEVLGGVRLHRDPAHPTRMDVIPNLSEGLDGRPYRLTFTDPGSAAEYEMEHRYQAQSGSYEFSIKGDFSEIPTLQLVTPPLPAGTIPRGDSSASYTVKTLKGDDGQVRYALLFDGMQGRQDISLSFGRLS